MESGNIRVEILTKDLDSEEFNFKCKVCGRNLSSRQNLKEHFFTHTGERPYVCTEEGCGQSFRQGSLLSIHRRIHKEVKNNVKETKVRRSISYLELTKALKPTSIDFDRPVDQETKTIILNSIKIEDFCFIQKFLK